MTAATVPSAAFLAPPGAQVPPAGQVPRPASAPRSQDTVFCAECEGTAPKNGDHPPDGWYSVFVSVPVAIRPRRKVWVGLFCSASCLAAHGPVIAAAEATATYDRVPAEGGTR